MSSTAPPSAVRVCLEERNEEAKAVKARSRFSGITALWERTKGQPPSPLALRQSRDPAYVRLVRKDMAANIAVILRFQAAEPGVERILLRAHYGMCYAAVRRFTRIKGDEADNMQEARLALLEACARFDATKATQNTGRAVSTFLWTYVKAAIVRYGIDMGEVVRIPVHQYGLAGSGRKHGTPNVFCFSEMPGEMTEEFQHSFEEALVDDSPPVDEAVGDMQIEHLGPLLVSELFERLLVTLSPREAEIVRQRLMKEEEDRPSRNQLGKEMNLSRERIRQLEEVSLEFFRDVTRKKTLRANAPASFAEWFNEALTRKDEEKEEWYRASGHSVCIDCEKPYYKHPHGGPLGIDDKQFLRRLCDGRLVKL